MNVVLPRPDSPASSASLPFSSQSKGTWVARADPIPMCQLTNHHDGEVRAALVDNLVPLYVSITLSRYVLHARCVGCRAQRRARWSVSTTGRTWLGRLGRSVRARATPGQAWGGRTLRYRSRRTCWVSFVEAWGEGERRKGVWMKDVRMSSVDVRVVRREWEGMGCDAARGGTDGGRKDQGTRLGLQLGLSL